MSNLIYISLLIISISSLTAENTEDTLALETPKVYIDYEFCDMDFVKSEIPYVNYVIDRQDADVYILVSSQTTAGEGTEFTIFFIGQKIYTGMNDTLKCSALISDSEDTIRKKIAKRLQLGLIRYLAKTPIAEKLAVTLTEKKLALVPKDPWRNWVFKLGVNTYLNGQQKMNFNTINTNISISKILENWKIMNTVDYYYTNNIYRLEDTTITTEKKSYSGSTKFAIGINNHLSAGGYASFYSSTYQNIYISSGIAPAIEYNLFPYNQSSSRKLTLQYHAGYVYFEYYEMTIYNKSAEKLFKESASLGIDIKQRWGTLDITLEASHYFHDFTKYRITLYNNSSLPILKGLSLNIFSYASMIRDQLSLPKRQLTDEEIILQKKLLATQYSYHLSIGISYSFGSIFSNIVNRRFEE